MSDIHPSEAGLQAMSDNPSDSTVVMLNLLKFKRGGGSKEYAKYSDAFQQVLERNGGRFLYLGRGAEMLVGNEDWDAIALVEYPSRKVFLELTSSPEYAAMASHRENGLERTVLYATDPRQATVETGKP